MNRNSVLVAIIVVAIAVVVALYAGGYFDKSVSTQTAIQTEPADEAGADATAPVAPEAPATDTTPESATQDEAAEQPEGGQATTDDTAASKPEEDPPSADDAGSQQQESAASDEQAVTGATGEGGAAQPQQQARTTTGEEAAEVEEGAPVPPSFDVVRVEPTGDAVIAGRAEPNSDVTVLDDGEVIGKTESDSRGEWVVITEEPLAPGTHRLELQSTTPEGENLISDNEVVIVVPGAPKVASAEDRQPASEATPEGQEAQAQGEEAPQVEAEQQDEVLAVVVPRGGNEASRVLQAPGDTGVADKDLVLQTVDYDENGRVILAGKGAPGARIVVYLDDEAFGETEVGPEGRWIVRPDERVPPGLHRLRVEQLDADGNLLAQIEIPFARAQFAGDFGGDRLVVVQPGNSLWVIARSAYGEGLRYTAIYRANIDQIEDPDLIYPGQIFLVPGQ